MYRSQFWVMGMYSGYGSAEEANERYRMLLERGQTGFSIALDLPTQCGYDADDSMSAGEVGVTGVHIGSLADMERLFEGIPLEKVRQIRTTANSIGPIIAAMYIAAFEKRGVNIKNTRMFLQNDVLKEYIARGTYIFPPEAGVKLSSDVIEYCARHLPGWTPLAMSGYHIRDSGSTAAQELAFTFSNGLAYVEEVLRRGMTIDSFAPQLWTFLGGGIDVLEEVAKFRAARRVWARLMRERYGATNPESMKLKIFAYTLGGNLVAQQPLNNIARVAIETLAAVLGGVQTIATSSYDEAWAIPTEEAATIALRTQQIVANEAGVTGTVDALGGSYAIESLTDALEKSVFEYHREDREARRGSGLHRERLLPSRTLGGRLQVSAPDRNQRPHPGRRQCLPEQRGAEHPGVQGQPGNGTAADRAGESAAQGSRQRAREENARRSGKRSPGEREPHACTDRGGEGLRDARGDLRDAARSVRGIPGEPGNLIREGLRAEEREVEGEMDYSQFKDILFERRDNGILWITLNRPDKFNAADAAMHQAFVDIWPLVDKDPEVRAVVITGAGKAFSAGGDLQRVQDAYGNHDEIVAILEEARDIVYNMLHCSKPIISAVNGVAVGAGVVVALLSDICIMGESARLADGHHRLGVAAGDHGAIIWPLLCGMAKAKYYLMTGDFVSGPEPNASVSSACACPMPSCRRRRWRLRPDRDRPEVRDPLHEARPEPVAAAGRTDLRPLPGARDDGILFEGSARGRRQRPRQARREVSVQRMIVLRT